MTTKWCKGCDARTCTCCGDSWEECSVCNGDFCYNCSFEKGESHEIGWVCNDCWERFKDFTLEELENLEEARCDFCSKRLGYKIVSNELRYVCEECEEKHEFLREDDYWSSWKNES